MASEVKKLDGNKITVTVKVSPEDFSEGLQKAYLKTRGKYSIPGFRKGKAPRRMIETYYGEGAFYEEAFDTLFPDAYGKAIDESGLDVVSRPENVDIIKIGKEEGLEFTVDAYVKPEVTVENYKGVEITKKEVKIGAKEVNAELKRVQEQNERWVEVDRAAKKGDTVVMDYSGSIDGEKFDGGTAEGQSLKLGSGMFIPGFEDQLEGKMAGEKCDVAVTFPEEYHADNLAGKEAVFAVNIISVKERELPELDDDFASDVSDFETLADYKKDIKKNLTKRAEALAKDEMENELIEKIVKATDIDVPQCMIDTQIDYQLQQLAYQLMYQGMKIYDYLQYTGKKLEDLRADYQDMALLQVKTRLCIDAMVKQEAVEAPKADVDALIADAADQQSKSVEDYEKTITDEDRNYFESRVKVDKLFDMLMAEAKFVEEKADGKEKKPAAKKASSKAKGEKKTTAKKASAKKTEE